MEDNKDIFKSFLKKRGSKWTPERKAIFDVVRSMRFHFEADELFFRLRQRKSKISKGSVYRTIKLLEAADIIRPVIFTERHTHYENILGRKHHSHLICRKCGRIIEFFRPEISDGLKKAYREYGFKEIDHKVEATGLCRKCQKKK
ncbi:MAG: transcriptional repressor [Candidatus Omnitrophica bacterium]|nr:transcriptional repressor [Candidatus Omnitrophota bacterium]